MVTFRLDQDNISFLNFESHCFQIASFIGQYWSNRCSSRWQCSARGSIYGSFWNDKASCVYPTVAASETRTVNTAHYYTVFSFRIFNRYEYVWYWSFWFYFLIHTHSDCATEVQRHIPCYKLWFKYLQQFWNYSY